MVKGLLIFEIEVLEIGYSINEEIIDKAKLESARIYLSATNLFTLSKFKIWDVEMGGNGLGYPIQKGINLGLNMNF